MRYTHVGPNSQASVSITNDDALMRTVLEDCATCTFLEDRPVVTISANAPGGDGTAISPGQLTAVRPAGQGSPREFAQS